MNRGDNIVDLLSCDREPIHQLGYIQDFGALLAVTADWQVAFRSTNVEDVLDPRKPIELGDRLAEHVSNDVLHALATHAANARDMEIVERVFAIDLLDDGRRFDLAIHISGSYIIIEMEPAEDEPAAPLTSALRPIMARLESCETTQELCEDAADQLKRLLGFDRVMVYRFHPDESGEVIAEAREPHLESFLNLRYPKTDIPQQARQLYLKNLFRIISDVDAEPVPIEPTMSLDGEPLDLSLSTLRAVSKIHIEYLCNMGVEASLSISIVVKGKLWGLFACHHYSPIVLPFQQRTMAELFAQLFALQLDLSMMTAGNLAKEQARRLHERLISQLAGGKTIADNLDIIDRAISRIIPHDGMSAYVDDIYKARGTAPDEAEFLAIVPALNTSSTGHLLHSDALQEKIPQAAAFADRAVGALVIPVSRRPRDYVVLWRRELQQVVTWAGNPEKVATVGPNGDRLTPRESFAAWRQSVDGKSSPWREEEVSIAENIRVTLLEVILRITDDQVQERAKAQERQELLIAELNHRVRNILTLIRSLIGQSRGEVKDVGEFADIVGGRIRALSMAHDQITRQQWAPASLKQLINEETEAYLTGKTDRVIISGPDSLIAPEAFTVIALVIHEMMTNSAKYGSLCDRSGRLEISLAFDKHTDLSISWREIGGPAVKAPERRGFGSTIIERSIPYELNGAADIRYNLKGVEADFTIPSRYAKPNSANGAAEGDDDVGSDEQDAPKLSATQRRGGVLLVEDSMIIAMDAEEMLRQLDFDHVMIAPSAALGLEELQKATPLFALLDYNLGDETSEAVAEELTRREVPFWFVTGYGDAIEQLSQSQARGVIQKPYTKEDLEQVVTSLAE